MKTPVALAQILNNEVSGQFSLTDFKKFVQKEHSEENLEYWEAVMKYRALAKTHFPDLPMPLKMNNATNLPKLSDVHVDSMDRLWGGENSNSKPVSNTSLANGLENLILEDSVAGGLKSSMPNLTLPDADPEVLNALRDEAEMIIKVFIEPGSEREINIPAKLRKRLVGEIKDRRNFHPDVFRQSAEHTYQTMKQSSFFNYVKLAAAK